MNKHHILFVIALFGFYLSILGQVHDTLLVYMQIAARNNPKVMQKYYEYRSAIEKIPQAASLPNPELSAGVFLSPMELVSGRQIADIRIMQMFPWFGALKSAQDEMGLMAYARFESLREAKLDIMYQVEELWYELYKTRAAIRISEKNLELLKAIEGLEQTKFRSGGGFSLSVSNTATLQSSNDQNESKNISTSMGGMSNMQTGNKSGTSKLSSTMSMTQGMGAVSSGSQLSQVIQIQIERLSLEENIAALGSRLIKQKANFNTLLGRPIDHPVYLPDSLEIDTLNFPVLIHPDSTFFSDHPMLKMFEYENQSVDARMRMIKRMGYPMIGVGLSYSVINRSEMSVSAMNGHDMLMPMVTISLPIYRKKYRAMQTETELIRLSIIQGYQAAYNELQVSWVEAIQDFNEAQRRLSLYERQCQLLKQTLEVLLQSFTSSGNGLSEVLLVRRQALDYELKKTEAIADLQIAIARIKKISAQNDFLK
ncbi:MAG: TolC family protein [Bacteroidales bacterium]|nr:TolC family protein [Bacteroidales bacterium]